jgi:hypothetical protein
VGPSCQRREGNDAAGPREGEDEGTAQPEEKEEEKWASPGRKRKPARGGVRAESSRAELSARVAHLPSRPAEPQAELNPEPHHELNRASSRPNPL